MNMNERKNKSFPVNAVSLPVGSQVATRMTSESIEFLHRGQNGALDSSLIQEVLSKRVLCFFYHSS